MVEVYKIICYQVRRYTPIPKDMFIIEYNNLKLKVCFENDTIYQKVQNKLKGRNLKEITILFAGKGLKEQDKTYYKIIKNWKQVREITNL